MAEYLPSSRGGKLNLLPLFIVIEKNDCFSIYNTG